MAPNPTQIEALAGLINGDSIDDVAALLGVSTSAIVSLADDKALMVQVDATAVMQRRNGEVIRSKSKAILTALLSRIESLVESEEMSAATAVKVADVLYKIIGIADERAVELRAVAAAPHTGFTVNINLSGRPVTSPAAARVIEHSPDFDFSRLPDYVMPASADANRILHYDSN